MKNILGSIIIVALTDNLNDWKEKKEHRTLTFNAVYDTSI